jgi:hypothetical protein
LKDLKIALSKEDIKNSLVALYLQMGSMVCDFCQEASYISYSFVQVTVTDLKMTLYVTDDMVVPYYNTEAARVAYIL